MDHSTKQQNPIETNHRAVKKHLTNIRIKDAPNHINECVEIKGWIIHPPKQSNSGIIFLDITDDPRYSSLQCVVCNTKVKNTKLLNIYSTLIIRGQIVPILCNDGKSHNNYELRVHDFKYCNPCYFTINELSSNLNLKKRCEYLVNGYVRSHTLWRCVCKDTQLTLINFLGDIFNDNWDLQTAADAIGKCIEIEGKHVKATACDCYYENQKRVYGTKIIYGYPLCQIYKWKIKLIEWEAYENMSGSFGVIANNNCLSTCPYWYTQNINHKYYGPELKEGDIIEINLDLKHKTLRYSINGNDLGTAYDNLPINNYKLAVTMPYDGVEIKLLDIY
eukprot:480200_1